MKDLIYRPVVVDCDKFGFEAWDKSFEDNFKKLYDLDALAKSRGSMVGRVVRFPYADGYSYYQIVKENKASYVLNVCLGLGDDWCAFGQAVRMDKASVDSRLDFEETMERLVSSQRKGVK